MTATKSGESNLENTESTSKRGKPTIVSSVFHGAEPCIPAQSLGRVRDPVRIAEGPTAIGAATQRRHFGFRLRLVDSAPGGGGSDRAAHSLVLGNVDGPRCHANQVVPATGLVDDAITTARKKGIVDQAGKPDLLPCRGNGFPAIRRRLTHGPVRYISRRLVHCGELFPQFLRGPLEELPEGQVGQLRFRPEVVLRKSLEIKWYQSPSRGRPNERAATLP